MEIVEIVEIVVLGIQLYRRHLCKEIKLNIGSE